MYAFLKEIKKPVLVTLTLLFLCGAAYPLLLTGLGQVLFPDQANGSLVEINGRAVGSKLVGQDFTDARFMKSRPSAVSYNTYTQEDKRNGSYAGLASGSQNFGPANPALVKRVEADIAAFLSKNSAAREKDLPADLFTASGSGLEPYISPASAAIQIPALAEATGLPEEYLKGVVREHTQGKLLGVFGEEAVNVLMVNLDIARKLGLPGSPE